MRTGKFQAPSCSLADLEFADLEAIRVWRNARMDVLRQNAPLTAEDQAKYWTRLSQDPRTSLFAVVRRDELIGYCGLTNIDRDYARAEISFLLDPRIGEGSPEYRTVFQDVLGMLCRYAFDRLRLHRVFTETYELRTSHIGVLEEFGLQKEGVLRDHVFKNGIFYDCLIHGMLQNEFK
jgi:RimJ/RimL family protein N-acetyltransferase